MSSCRHSGVSCASAFLSYLVFQNNCNAFFSASLQTSPKRQVDPVKTTTSSPPIHFPFYPLQKSDQPMKSPGGKNPYQNVNPAAMHGGARGVGSRPAARVGGGGNAVRGDGARIPAFAAAQASPAVQEKAPPPPPPAAAGPGRVPT